MFAAKMPARWITSEEYLQQEETSTERHEYCNGEVSLLEGGTHNHEMARCNSLTALHQHARRCECRAFGCNMKIIASTNEFITYPDAMLVCSKIEFAKTAKISSQIRS